MTALLLHTTLSVVLVAWAYVVTSRVPYRPAWIWTGTLLVILVGYVSLIARSVFEGSPVRVQAIVGEAGAMLLTVSTLVCLVMYGLVSRGPSRPAARGATRADVSGWAPREDDSVISADDADGWDEGPVIDAGSWPSSGDAEDDAAPRGGRYAFPSADEPEPAAAPAPARSSAPAAPLTQVPPPATSSYRPPAAPYRPPAAPYQPPLTSYQPVPATSSETAPPTLYQPPPTSYQPTAPVAPATPYETFAPKAPAPMPAVYTPVAPPPMAPPEWQPEESADEDDWENRAPPRRAMPSATDMES